MTKTTNRIAALFVLLLPALGYGEKEIHGVRVMTEIEELVDPAHALVLVVDMQNENVLASGHYYAAPDWKRSDPVPDNPEISQHYEQTHDVAKLAEFLDSARRAGVTVAYLEFVFLGFDQSGIGLMYGPERVAPTETARWWSITHEQLAPREGEVVIHKHHGDGFKDTILDPFLRARSIKSLIITGTATNGCVLATTWGAEMRGYYPVLVRDVLNQGTDRQREEAQFKDAYDKPPDKAPGAYYERCLTFMETRYPVFETDDIMAAWERIARPASQSTRAASTDKPASLD